MSYLNRFRLGSAVLSLAILVSVAAAPAAATVNPDDTGKRLEAARTVLASGVANLSASQVSALSKTLSDALESSHFGFQTSALRLLIAYGPEVDFDRTTVIEVVRLYRDHNDERVRRMAVVALGAMDDAWGDDFLMRSLRYESSAPVRHTIAAVLATDQAREG